MAPFPTDFSKLKIFQITPLSELPEAVRTKLPDVTFESCWDKPSPIRLISKKRQEFTSGKKAGHYFAGGLPALMQAVRLLEKENGTSVTYVNDGKLKKSTQSAHQGHVHPTEWTTPDLRTIPLMKMLANSLHILPPAAPEDVERYQYHHFPLSKIDIPLFLRFFCFRMAHTLLSKNSISADDRWQCDAVRASLNFHKKLSDEIEQAGGKPTFAYGIRLIWSPDAKALEEKRKLWSALGIKTEYMDQNEFKKATLFKEQAPVYALKVFGDGKFFPNIEQEIIQHFLKKYPNRFQTRTKAVSELYLDEITGVPIAVKEADGENYAVDSFFGSPGHNQVFRDGKKKPLWKEVPVSGVSTLWVCSINKSEFLQRFGTVERIKQQASSSNLTNLHLTVWDAIIDNDTVHIIARATQGANFNSEIADPNDLLNMQANLHRFFTGCWQLISCGTCIRKTTVSNIPQFQENFVHGLSGIGFSFSAAPSEMFSHTPLSKNFLTKLRSSLFSRSSD